MFDCCIVIKYLLNIKGIIDLKFSCMLHVKVCFLCMLHVERNNVVSLAIKIYRILVEQFHLLY